ncbi:MAG: hypothetical protein V1921_08905 [Candidatus Altiarchaeota archaeon]
MYNLVDVRKLGKKFEINKKVKTPMIRVSCEQCFSKDIVCSYEKDLPKRDFPKAYKECADCMTILCENCLEEKKECPECGSKTHYSLKPYDIYLCNVCVEHDERVCPTCRYPSLEETFLFPD